MNKESIIEKLREIGIESTNCFPKSSFKKDDDVFVGCFKRELEDDFYFYNTYDKKIYLVPKVTEKLDDKFAKEEFAGKIKYQVPLTKCTIIWEDKPYVELKNKQYKEMTLREYACIMLRVPLSETEWLNNLITQANSSSNERLL